MGRGGISVQNESLTPAIGGSNLVGTQDGEIISGVTTEIQLMSTASAFQTSLASGQTVSSSTPLTINANEDRKSIAIQSTAFNGTDVNPTVYIGDSALDAGDLTGVTTGLALFDTDTYTDDRYNGAFKVVCADATGAWIRVWERD